MIKVGRNNDQIWRNKDGKGRNFERTESVSGRGQLSGTASPSEVSPKSFTSHASTPGRRHRSASGLQQAPTRLEAPPAALWLAPINHPEQRGWRLQDTDQRQLAASWRRRVLITSRRTKSPGEIASLDTSRILRSGVEAACRRRLPLAE